MVSTEGDIQAAVAEAISQLSQNDSRLKNSWNPDKALKNASAVRLFLRRAIKSKGLDEFIDKSYTRDSVGVAASVEESMVTREKRSKLQEQEQQALDEALATYDSLNTKLFNLMLLVTDVSSN